MIRPTGCYLGIALSFGASLWLFATARVDADRFFYLPLVGLILFHTLYGVLTDRTTYWRRPWRCYWPKVIGKTVFWALLVGAVTKLYAAHPLYRDFTPQTRRFLGDLQWAIWVGGPMYFLLAERTRSHPETWLADPYLRFLSLWRACWKGRFRVAGRRLVRGGYRRWLLMALIRIHYLPIMLQQVYFHVTTWTGTCRHGSLAWTFSMAVALLTTLAWMIDSNNGALGYFWESVFTRTRFRAIDPDPLHWIVVLMCYAPFIELAARFAPFPSLPQGSAPVVGGLVAERIFDGLLVAALAGYALSGSALAFSTSNLCYKQIQTRGPYALVRHPATTCKLIFFFLAFFRYRAAWGAAGLLCYGFWAAVYVCRALAEEQFLVRFPEYRAYQRRTRYRFLPGLV